MSAPVTCSIDAGVATITLDRPDAKNRLDAESMGLLLEHLRATAEDPGVRVVVLTGSGTTFCSGADLAGAVAATSGGFGVLSAGLVTRVVEADALDAAVAAYVDQLRLGGPEAVARTKELLRRVPAMTIAAREPTPASASPGRPSCLRAPRPR